MIRWILVGVFGPAASVAAQVSNEPSVSVYTLTPERIAASLAAVVGLIGAVIGGLALVRAARRIGGNGRRGAVVALVMAPIGLSIGGLVVAAWWLSGVHGHVTEHPRTLEEAFLKLITAQAGAAPPPAPPPPQLPAAQLRGGGS